MLQKIFTRPVELTINDRVITFKSIDDFEFALIARTTMPLEKINDALQSSSAGLSRELNAITVAIENIEELIQQSTAAGDVTQQLKSINPIIFSSDNDWRELFFELKKNRSTESSLYKQIALKNYLIYLNNRHSLIHSVKTLLDKDNAEAEQLETASFDTGELDIDNGVDCKSLGAELGLTRIGNGKTCELFMEAGDEIPLLLANYRCKLKMEMDQFTFIDHDEEEYPLLEGENKIGRGSECTIRFIETLHRISRLHLLIKIQDNRITLTDLSTYGTHYLRQVSS